MQTSLLQSSRLTRQHNAFQATKQRKSCVSVQAANDGAVAAKPKAVTKPPFPFVRIAGQEDMKLALMLNVVDPNIGGCLIMGDRGTGKSVAVSFVRFERPVQWGFSTHSSYHLLHCVGTPSKDIGNV